MDNEHKNPLPHETYLRVILIDNGGALVENVTYGMVHTGTSVSYWDKRYYQQEKESYKPIIGKNHTYYVYGCEPELARKIAILYHAKHGNLTVWTLD